MNHAAVKSPLTPTLHSRGVYIHNHNATDDNERLKLAFQYFARAADLGLPQAQYNLGGFYLLGRGVEQNLKEGFRWIKTAVESKMGEQAELHLATLYLEGMGTEQDVPAAVAILQKYHENGNLAATSYLASIYNQGLGSVAQDTAQAFRLYAQIVSHDFPLDQGGGEGDSVDPAKIAHDATIADLRTMWIEASYEVVSVDTINLRTGNASFVAVFPAEATETPTLAEIFRLYAMARNGLPARGWPDPSDEDFYDHYVMNTHLAGIRYEHISQSQMTAKFEDGSHFFIQFPTP